MLRDGPTWWPRYGGRRSFRGHPRVYGLVRRTFPEAAERALNHFYEAASAALARRDALIDKLVGDEVMGLFLTVFPSLGAKTCDAMLDCADEILDRLDMGVEGGLPVGIGVNFGVARVGNVGVGEVKDFTAVGDVVNTAARLQASALSGQIVMSEAVFTHVAGRYPEAEQASFSVKGKAQVVPARVISTVR